MFDFTKDEAQSGFKPLPEGKYLLLSETAEVKETKSGNGKYIKIRFKVSDGEGKGRTLFHNFNVEHENKKAQDIGRSQIKGFMVAAGFKDFSLSDVNDLCGYKVEAKVKVEKNEEYGDQNRITSFSTPKVAKNSDIPF